MFDVKWIRENPEAFDRGRARRNLPPLSAEIVALDAKRRAAQTSWQEMQARRNELSKQIGQLKSKGQDAGAVMAEVAALKDKMADAEAAEQALAKELEAILATQPNLPADDVPEGLDEKSNREERVVGGKPNFAFTPKQHFEIGEGLGLMSFEDAAKLSGARFVVLKGGLARLERAIAQFMLDLHTGELGYTEVSPPFLVRDTALFGTGQLPKFAEDQFRTEQGLWLIPTSEVPLTNLAADEIIDETALPWRFTALTPCFRSEAGAAGKDTRGMIRQHQFLKVELVSIAHPDHSDEEHKRMTNCAEEVLKRLGLPYRVITLVHRRHGLLGAEDLRHRGLAAGPERLSRDLELLELRRVPGAAHEGALPQGGREGHALRPHAQRLRPRGRAHPGRHPRKLSAAGWIGRHSRSAASLYERP